VKVYSLPPDFLRSPDPSGKDADPSGKNAPSRALIFDMDGTLYTHPGYLASQTELPLRRLARFHGKTYETMKAEFDAYRAAWEKEHRGRAGEEKISMGSAFTAFGISIEENVRWREELYQPERYLTEDRRLRETLLRLSGEGRREDSPGGKDSPVLLTLLTNNPVSIARRTLRCLGVADCFSAITGLDTCMVSKPHRTLFSQASLGLPPERCVSIGDRYEIDIALPLEMGMGGVLVDGVEDVYALPDLLLRD
jgi:phosphoglycolate phosphatase/putative hydrolase of the HAD superfamily